MCPGTRIKIRAVPNYGDPSSQFLKWKAQISVMQYRAFLRMYSINLNISFFSLRGDVAFSETAKQRKSYPERHQRCARFYRAMQYSAKRGITIASRPSVCRSVCPSVTLVNQDHIGWKSWKLIVRTISPKAIYLLPGEHGDILGD